MKPVKKLYRDHSERALNLLESMVQSKFTPEEFSDVDEVDSLVSKFLEKLTDVYNTCCPIKTKTISYKRYIKPWLTSSLIEIINKKHYFFRKYKKGDVAFQIYNDYKLLCDKKIVEARMNYIENRFTDALGSSSATWKVFNGIFKNKAESARVNLVNNGTTVSNDVDLANLFNNYFSEIGINLDSKIPTVSKEKFKNKQIIRITSSLSS